MSDDFYLWYFKKYCDWGRGNYGGRVLNMEHRSNQANFQEQFKEDALVDARVAFALETSEVKRSRMETYQNHVILVTRKAIKERRAVRKWFKENCL